MSLPPPPADPEGQKRPQHWLKWPSPPGLVQPRPQTLAGKGLRLGVLAGWVNKGLLGDHLEVPSKLAQDLSSAVQGC